MSRTDKRVWGVLGKQQTYFSPQKQVEGKSKTPLNANAFDSWDAKRSRFKRVDGYENAIQQGGTVIGQSQPSPTPQPTPTPSATSQPTPTPSFTPTVTPSSTPYPIQTPDLWFDASDSSTMYNILSGGTTLTASWTSKGNYNWTLSGANSNRYTTYSGSSRFPGNPNIVRFTVPPTGGAGTRQGFQAFNNPQMPVTGGTIFYVFALPSGSPQTLIAYQNFIYSGNSTGGYAGTGLPPRIGTTVAANSLTNLIKYPISNQNWVLSNYSGSNINSMYFVKAVMPYTAVNPFGEVNNSSFTSSTTWTGTSEINLLNNFIMGGTADSGGTVTYTVNNIELAEIMYFGRTLSLAEQDQVELYLKDKWRYSEW